VDTAILDNNSGEISLRLGASQQRMRLHQAVSRD
jgi:hypothetical protein